MKIKNKLKSGNNSLLAIAFISGFSIMAIEIAASRLLAPHFGTSIFVWTNIIGVVMVSLSLGYYFGGKLSDKNPSKAILLKILFLAGFLLLIIPVIVSPLASNVNARIVTMSSSTVVIFYASLLVTIILFAVPLFLLGMANPFIVKLYLLEKSDNVGESVGLITAISTVGSILGTFLPTLYFIPTIGTKATIYFFSSCLIIVGCLGFKKMKYRFIALAIAISMGIFYAEIDEDKRSNIIFQKDSAYQYFNVKQDLFGTNYLSINSGMGFQSIYNKERILTGAYYDYFSVLPYLIEKAEPKNVLIIGLCGGTIANQLNHFFSKEVKIDGVEIDAEIIDVAKKYFAVDPTVTTIFNSDGRMFLRSSFKKYDLIIIDAYAQEFYVPWTMTTEEFWRLAKEHLTAQGMVAINLNSTAPDSPLLAAISNTMASVFNFTSVTYIDNNGINYVLTASEKPVDFDNLVQATKDDQLKAIASAYKNSTRKVVFSEDSVLLTDDMAPVEFMTEGMILNYLKK
ncbi:MAG: spermine synthase [uncultured bacterium]|nr:MAG: spermine synthase [uncultured bacterium]